MVLKYSCETTVKNLHCSVRKYTLLIFLSLNVLFVKFKIA